jgi:hypothetical protein
MAKAEKKRSRVFFEIKIGKENLGRINFELVKTPTKTLEIED